MNKYILKIDGMKCGMCESHVNDILRKRFKLKKVSSSHSKNETIMLTEEEISFDEIKNAFEDTGYKIIDIEKSIAIKKGLFWK